MNVNVQGAKTVNVHNLKVHYEGGRKVVSFSSLANGTVTTLRADDVLEDGRVRVFMLRSKLKDPRFFQHANQVIWLKGNWKT